MKVLVIDDEPDLVEVISISFRLHWQGCEVVSAYDGEAGLATFLDEQPDLVILDMVMPRLDGFEVCRRIRKVSAVPVIVLSVRGEEANKIKALELGADDYLTKPFSHLELLARVRAVMRRVEGYRPEGGDGVFECGELVVDYSSRDVSVGKKVVRLTATEHKLLCCLARNAGHVLPHRTLLAKVWGHEYVDELDYLKVFIRRLREKIEADPGNPRYILTERATGYQLVRHRRQLA